MLHDVRVHTHTETKIAIFAANVNLIMTAIDFGNEILCCTQWDSGDYLDAQNAHCTDCIILD